MIRLYLELPLWLILLIVCLIAFPFGAILALLAFCLQAFASLVGTLSGRCKNGKRRFEERLEAMSKVAFDQDMLPVLYYAWRTSYPCKK
jgi:hypothetical protein